jgi:WG containing repeat
MLQSKLTASLLRIFLASLSLSASAAQSPKQVSRVEIRSGWGGLGNSQNAALVIRQEKGEFRCEGQRVDPSLVAALVSALNAPILPKLDLANIGITPAWLERNVARAEQNLAAEFSDATASQKDLFAKSFTDPAVIAKVVPQLFQYVKMDDYPYAEVEAIFDDGSKLSAKSHSYYAFLLPWQLSENGQETFNANISRALSALLPPRTANKDRLAGDELTPELAQTLLRNIDTDWKMLGVESRAADALAALRSVYTVQRADINSYHSEEFGVSWRPKGPYELNLHATLHKSTMPENVFDELILLYDHDKVQGVQEFLNAGARYEDALLSVPWVLDYFQKHPGENAYILQVHGTSVGEHAMQTFAQDMKARGREDLIAQVASQQSQITLLKVGAADWLLFPDKRMMLWRYGGPSGLLKWTPSDFPPGLCGAYRSTFGGCSGREVSPDGVLLSEHAARDQDCMAAHRTTQSASAPEADELFPVMDHDRAGFIDRAGEVIIPLCFDKVGAFAEGLARFERDGRWGYMDASGSVVIEPRFPWAQEFSEGLARVQVSGDSLGYDGRWGFIDKTGKLIISPDYKSTLGGNINIGADPQDAAFHDGLAMIEVDGKTGFIDKTGALVIPPVFSYACSFSEGFAAATKSPTGNEGWGYIDKTGNWAISPQFEWASSFREHLAPVNRRHDCGYIGPTGDFALRPKLSPDEKDCATVWGEFAEGLSRWKIGNKYGFIDRSGNFIIAPQFDLAFNFSEGLAAVRVGRKWGCVDKTGKMVITPHPFAHVEDFRHGLAFVNAVDGKYGYIDRQGRYVWTPTLLCLN